MKKILIILGTRPDAIKCAPLIMELRKHPKKFDVKVCATGQHKEMLQQVLFFFNISVDWNLQLMSHDQSLSLTISETISGIDKIIKKYSPDFAIVQGDANPAVGGALAAFYNQTKIIHLEAGLRSHNLSAPYPEEGNRLIVSKLANIHLCPTVGSAKNLAKEGIERGVFVVGNTVIDSLFFCLKKVLNNEFKLKYLNGIDFKRKTILITGHRRESFGKPFERILESIKEIASKYLDINFIYPVHLNPNVLKPVKKVLSGSKNIHLIQPLDYQDMVLLMSKSYLIITDSGGIQEEAPSLGKPVIVTREITERMEGVLSGNAILVGNDKDKIKKAIENLIEDHDAYKKIAMKRNPYGDGFSSKKIVEIILMESQ